MLVLLGAFECAPQSAPPRIEQKPADVALNTPDPPGFGRSSAAVPVITSTLHVVGNHLEDHGKPVRLFGVNHSGTETSCRGWHGETSLFQGPTDESLVAGMKTWHVNAVRIPVNEDCWLGINGIADAMGGRNYQRALVNYVRMLRNGGLYVIFDLHMNSAGDVTANGANISEQQAMADRAHSVDFWKTAAWAFKDDPGVLFDLYNEPAINDGNKTITGCDGMACWECWLKGCSLQTRVRNPQTHEEQPLKTVTWETAGMQALVDAVRSVGAGNVVLAGGLNYASQLDHWVKYKPTDPRNNLAASFHTYSGVNDCRDADDICLNKWWNRQLSGIVEAGHPIVAGEFGEYGGCATESDFMKSWLAFSDPKGISYAAWTWDTWGDCASGPNLIKDYDGTPNGASAQAYHDYLLKVAPLGVPAGSDPRGSF